MTLDEIKKKKQKAYDCLKPLDEGQDYETVADLYERAFDTLDEALNEAITMIETRDAYIGQAIETIEANTLALEKLTFTVRNQRGNQ